MDAEQDVRTVVHESIVYVADISDHICDSALKNVEPKQVGREVFRSMRTHLSTPTIFASLRVLRHLQQMIKHAADAYANGEIAFSPPKEKKCSVNYTMRRIYSHIIGRVYKQVGRDMEAQQLDNNPYQDISDCLDGIIGYIAQKQFGININ